MATPPPEPVHRIIYLSRAVPGLTDSAVEELVRSARSKNQRLGITGALLFERDHFFQILEGPTEKVRNLFRAIRNDDRHREVRLLVEDDLEKRQFEFWSLAWNRESGELLSEHFADLKKAIVSSSPTQCDLELIQKFLVLFHGLLSAKTENEAVACDSGASGSLPW